MGQTGIRSGSKWTSAVLLALLVLSALSSVTWAADGPTVMVTHNDKLGAFLTDAKGMTLYLYTRDTRDLSNCYGQCEVNWPPLFVDAGDPVAPAGLPGTLGTTTRKDGKRQVTYNGWPLYYWVKDKAVGDTLGQGVGKVWYVLSPDAAPVDLAGTSRGSALVGPNGMTLYVYSKDTVGTSNCYGQCETNWPPLLSKTATPAPLVGLQGTLGTTIRKDGSFQVTYNGMPLYYWVKDKAVGDTTGQAVGKVWWIAHPGLFLDAAGHWAEYDVTEGVKGGWITGMPDGTFHPDAQVTRAEFVKMIMGAFGKANSTAAAAFGDTASHWGAAVIQGAVAAGIVKVDEYTGAMFEPDRPITREEVAVMVVRALGMDAQASQAAAPTFSDTASISALRRGYVSVAAQKGLVGGYPDGTVRPGGSASRGEAVAMVLRALRAK